MLRKLKSAQTPCTRSLFGEMDIHLPPAAILAGDIHAEIYADDAISPRYALTWTGHRFYLAGSPPGETDLADLLHIILDVYRPQAQALGKEIFYIHYPVGERENGWKNAIESMLSGRDPIRVGRQYYAWERIDPQRPPPGWRAMLPAGFELRPVDADLLADTRLINPAFLTEEMLSERPSVEDFLARSFGVCLVHAGEIVGWCLSEYNTGDRCEVGIATRQDFQRRGLATLMTIAFIELALSRGVTRIGWHCSADNTPSGATALRAGFEKVTDYPIYLGWFDQALNLTQNGYFSLYRQHYPEALAYFERSFALGDLPDWAYWGAACAAARLGQLEQAFGYLDQAISRGFRDAERMRSSEHLDGLRGEPAWKALVKRLEQA